MGGIDDFRWIVCDALSEYVRIQYANGDIQNEAVFDCENDRYLVVSVGWQDARRVHGVLIHIDIISDKIWIQRDGTEQGIANDLVKSGIPKDHIALGFHAPDVRQYTDFAVA
jgi:hypothetical protein